MSSFDLKQIQNKLKFQSAKLILLSEVSHLRAKSNHAKKNLLKRVRNDVTRANAVSERKKSFKKFDFFQL